MKVLIVGLGSIGKRHLKNILSTADCEIIVYSKHTNLKSSVKKNVKIFNTLDACLSEKPDVAFITNETAYHIPIALKLAEAGLDMFVEKPLSHNMKDVYRLCKMIKREKIISLMGCNLRFNKALQEVKYLIEHNTIGKILSVKAECGTYLPSWHPYENYSKSYSARDDLGGGVVLTCIHEIDYLYWFFGKIEEVFSITGKISNLKIRTDDLSAIILRFKNNIVGEIHLDYFQRPESRSCKIIGTKGTIFWDYVKNEVKIYDIKRKKWLKKRITNNNKNEMYVKEIKHFFHCGKNKKRTINDVEQGMYVLDVALKIVKSSKMKKMLKVTN